MNILTQTTLAKNLDWNAIDTVLLDMDGTLLDLHFDNYFWLTYLPERYAEVHSIPLNEAHETLHKLISDRVGTLQWYCLDHWSDLVKMDIPALKLDIQHKIAIRPHAEAFLHALRRCGKKAVLITNAHPKGLELKLKVTKIDRWLDVIVSSHEFQSPKEEDAFWTQLQEKEAFNPERTLFIDDTARILTSAKNHGIEHLVFVSQPDSQKPARSQSEYRSIVHFDEIMPPEVDE